ncbi:hypothetical protein LTR56_003843 [Elasticomyces elasticus]|nr:hypothetical protein LTR22_026430 [Elasticomyces elasticus]KAK3654985.1 hypothetical protein LTR56_003843 [Elasticomyces elasticus]KAK4928683.1 hypothetical protein LTR49_004492 [Elasticomyces elasticus]KAK5740316.1 hypothetical protein LTS12_024992 [Elasticomyces elasticus]
MTFSTRSALRAGMLGLFIAQSIAQNSSYSNSTAKLEPCAVLSAAAANGITQFDAGLAMACLQSIPVDVDGDIQEILGLKVLVQFQSDLAYLKDPPPGYLYPGVDILGGLDAILADVQAGAYKSDYDVQLDLYKLVTSAYDFHFNWVPDLVDVFGWMREGKLISLSSDSVSLPEVYDFQDLHAFGPHNFSSSSYTPSAVTNINGVDSETWLNEFAALNPWDHDPDANYNNIFVNIPRAAVTDWWGGSYIAGWLYQGDDTVLTFANDTVRHVHTYARTSCDLSGVTDGPSFFRQCTSQKHPTIKHREGASRDSSQNAYTPVPTADWSLRRPRRSLQPFVTTSDMTLAGYFPPDQPDVVVVACPSLGPANNYDFQNAFGLILATARLEGKSKLILDLRGNGGGIVRMGYDMFKQLFPGKVPYGSANLAAFPLVNALGNITTYQMAINNWTDRNAMPLVDYDVIDDLTISLTHYDSWADFYGPVQRNGGNFTNLKRYNMTDRYSFGTSPVGYGNDIRPQPQTFASDDIVILSDGFCGSTCSLFAEFMKTQAGVHAIAVGGRKQHGPMQFVGGSKGASDVPMRLIAFSALHALEVATTAQLALAGPYTDSEKSVKHALTRIPTWGRARVNFENNIREGDDSVTPLHFVYEAADYRFFYTSAMVLDQSLVWKRAYDVRWNNGSCVPGSTGHPSSVSGKLMEL